MNDQHDSSHHHEHGHGHHHPASETALAVSFFLNFGFLIVEVVVGLLTNSLVLLSDAGHMVSDVAALALALFTQRLARLRPGGAYTFGYRRAPVLGAFGNALTLYIIVVLIFKEAWERLLNPPPVAGLPVLVIGIAGLAVNGLSALWLYRSKDESLNIRGALIHLLADAIGSLGAIIAALVMIFTGWVAIDPLISILIGFLILSGTWPLLRDSIKVLLQASPRQVPVDEVREFLLADPFVSRLADLHIWEVNSGEVIFMATLITDRDSCSLEAAEIASDRLRPILRAKYGIEHATFEWRTVRKEPLGCEESLESRSESDSHSRECTEDHGE